MAITNPEAISFVNAQVRPMCEKIRALKAELDAMRTTYDAGVGSYFYGHGAEAIEDGRDAEGISRLTGDDILSFVSIAPYALKALLDTSGYPEAISKPCVRALEAR